MALSLVLAACGGSADEATEDEASATSASTPAPAAEATSDAASPTPTSAPAAADTPESEPTPAGSESDEAAPDPAALAEHLRERTMQMWDVYNTHDPDTLKAFYEPGYWAAEEEEVRSNMNPFRTFGIEIRAEETSPPTEIAPGKWEIRHTGHFPLGSVKMVFIWEEFEGEWLMTYAEVE
ncbi:MAG: hypothetical protein OXC71_06580 [Chloroflexi bacterium]|nr:hypothetical protein [Chloroflexota bacterium]